MKNYKHSLSMARKFLEFCSERLVYGILGKPAPWGATDLPPSQTAPSGEDVSSDIYSAVIAEKILEADLTLVIRRVNWQNGKVFAQWSSYDTDIATKDFYCLNSELNVYKCISNNSGAASTIEPLGTTPGKVGTADGYVWRYLFTVVDTQHLTPNYIPIKEIVTSEVGYEDQYASQVAAVPGEIDRIDVVQRGTKYSANVSVVIYGDGVGATATPVRNILTGEISSVNVSGGSGYTWARVVIVDTDPIPGSGCILRACISPQFGHGGLPSEELFATKILCNKEFLYPSGSDLNDETVLLRKVILVADPKKLTDNVETTMVSADYVLLTKVNLSGSADLFEIGEMVEDVNGNTAFIVSKGTNQLLVSEMPTPLQGLLVGQTSGASRTVTSVLKNNLLPSNQILFRDYFEPLQLEVGETLTTKTIFSF